MDLEIKGRVALVTGASRGIGKAVAMSLAQAGVEVCLMSRNQENLAIAQQDIESGTGIKPMTMVADVSDAELAKVSVEKVVSELGGLDILVNNCEGPAMGTFLEQDADAWRRAYELNLYSVVNYSTLAAALMKENKWGRILNITSFLAKEPTSAMVLSATMRAGVSAFSKAISIELAEHGVTVNTICPSAVLTDRMVNLTRVAAERESKTYDEILDNAKATIPAGRFSTPEEIGDLAAFLASDRAAYITGVSHLIDGGLSKSYF